MTDTSNEWFDLTFRTSLQVTDRTALATAAFDRVIDPETGEESMMTWDEDFGPNAQLKTYLRRILSQTLELVGKDAGFTWRLTAVVDLEPMEPRGV